MSEKCVYGVSVVTGFPVNVGSATTRLRLGVERKKDDLELDLRPVEPGVEEQPVDVAQAEVEPEERERGRKEAVRRGTQSHDSRTPGVDKCVRSVVRTDGRGGTIGQRVLSRAGGSFGGSEP